MTLNLSKQYSPNTFQLFTMIYKPIILSILLATLNVVKKKRRRNQINYQQASIKRKFKRRPRPQSDNDPTPIPYRKDYRTSTWWEMIHDPYVEDPTSHVGKKFRLRFRVPFPVFRKLLEMAQTLGFDERPKSAAGVEGIPLEIQVLSVLRVLGK